MTNEEALKHFKSLQKRYTTQHNGVMCEKVKVAIEAIEKQIPKKPFVDIYGDLDYMCPACHRIFKKIRKGKMFAYCADCGQALDWSDE